MKIFYRISSKKPDNQGLVYPNDKKRLVDFSHDSFLKAGGDKYDTTYILDSCEGWTREFEKYGKVVNIKKGEKFKSLVFTFELAKKEKGKILFLEDDYLWRPNTLEKVDFALSSLPVVSPYDHPAHYTEDRFSEMFEMRLVGDNVYRTCPSNTHTFGTTAEILNKHWDCLVDSKGRAKHDHPAFTELNKVAQMWCPTHSFATHLASGCLAPNVDWKLPI